MTKDLRYFTVLALLIQSWGAVQAFGDDCDAKSPVFQREIEKVCGTANLLQNLESGEIVAVMELQLAEATDKSDSSAESSWLPTEFMPNFLGCGYVKNALETKTTDQRFFPSQNPTRSAIVRSLANQFQSPFLRSCVQKNVVDPVLSYEGNCRHTIVAARSYLTLLSGNCLDIGMVAKLAGVQAEIKTIRAHIAETKKAIAIAEAKSAPYAGAQEHGAAAKNIPTLPAGPPDIGDSSGRAPASAGSATTPPALPPDPQH